MFWRGVFSRVSGQGVRRHRAGCLLLGQLHPPQRRHAGVNGSLLSGEKAFTGALLPGTASYKLALNGFGGEGLVTEPVSSLESPDLIGTVGCLCVCNFSLSGGCRSWRCE